MVTSLCNAKEQRKEFMEILQFPSNFPHRFPVSHLPIGHIAPYNGTGMYTCPDWKLCYGENSSGLCSFERSMSLHHPSFPFPPPPLVYLLPVIPSYLVKFSFLFPLFLLTTSLGPLTLCRQTRVGGLPVLIQHAFVRQRRSN